MTRKLRLTAALAALLLLCGCMRVRVSAMPTIPHIDDSTSTAPPAAEPTPTPTPTPTMTSAQLKNGSVGLLSEPTVLLCVFLQDAAHGSSWSTEERAAALQQVDMAVSWIDEQAQGYGTSVQLYYAADTDSELCCTYDLQTTVQGGENSQESDEFFAEMDTLCETLDTGLLQAGYGTDRIGYLFFLPVSGTSFTMVHYLDDGEIFYYEYSCIYRSDAYSETIEPESPATYAHEILHMFGAPDLYDGSNDFIVDEALTSYMEATYPDDIMLSTYEADGSNRYDMIDKIISPLTAYCLGLTESCAEQELFPALNEWQAGTFYYDEPTETAQPAWDWLDYGAIAV